VGPNPKKKSRIGFGIPLASPNLIDQNRAAADRKLGGSNSAIGPNILLPK